MSQAPSQQYFSHVGTCLPGLNQNKVSFSVTQHSDYAFSEAHTSDPLIELRLNKSVDGTT